MKKKKTTAKEAWACEITYTQQKTKDLIKQLNQEIKKQNNWIDLLQEKKVLEEQLSVVRIEILKRCVIDACKRKNACEMRIAELKKSKPKKVSRK